MKCEGCKLEEELILGGYDARDYVCTCSLKQQVLRGTKEAMLLFLIPPIIVGGLFLVFVDWVIDG